MPLAHILQQRIAQAHTNGVPMHAYAKTGPQETGNTDFIPEMKTDFSFPTIIRMTLNTRRADGGLRLPLDHFSNTRASPGFASKPIGFRSMREKLWNLLLLHKSEFGRPSCVRPSAQALFAFFGHLSTIG